MDKIDTNQNWMMIARDIFDKFELHQNIAILGWEMVNGEPIAIGKLVCDEIERLDRLANTQIGNDGKAARRKRYKPPNTIGGYVAQKIWKYKEEIRGTKIIWTIWRMQ